MTYKNETDTLWLYFPYKCAPRAGDCAALACSQVSDFGLPQLILAFAPGGMAEMGLLTLALGIDVALVTTCHVARLILVYMIVPFVAGRVSTKEQEKMRAADTGFNDD